MSVALHLIRASHLNAVIQNMHSLSIPIEPLLEKAGLNILLSKLPNQLILENKIWRFLALAAESKNMPHLTTLLTEKSDLSQYGEFSKRLVNAGNLYQALLLLTSQINLHNSNTIFTLKEDAQYTWICHPHSEHVKEGKWQVEQHVMSFICMLIEHYAGNGWQPKKIKLQDVAGLGVEQSRFFKNADIKLGQQYSAIAIERSLLEERALVNELAGLSELDYIPDNFAQGFKVLLKQNYFGRDWLAEDIAATLEVSVRTLKRKLQVQGTSLRKVFDEVRFQQACDLIAQGVHEYEVLATQLSYTHPNNFVRAFKRWSGITPKEYIRLRNIKLISQKRYEIKSREMVTDITCDLWPVSERNKSY